MPEPITQGLFFETIRQLEEKMLAQHHRLRDTIETRFDQLNSKLTLHEDDDRVVADRVLVMETQRAEEARQAIKRGTWAGLLAASAIGTIMEVLKVWFHR